MGKRRLVALGAACALAATVSGCGLFGDGDNGGGGSSPPPGGSSNGAPSQSVEPGKLPPPVQTKRWTNGTTGNDESSAQIGVTHDVLVSVYGVYRDGEYATLLMSAQLDPADTRKNEEGFNITSALQRANLKAADTGGELGNAENADDLTLVDPNAKKAYLAARTAEGNCVCTHQVTVIQHWKDVFTTVYAAPPAESTKVDVSVPNIGYYTDIPVFDQQAPEIEKDVQAPTPVNTEPLANEPPASAEVVDITGEVSNIDLSVVRSKDKVTLDANVLFEFDEATLTSKAKSRIAEAAEILKQRAEGQRVQVNGFTDSKGSNSYNKRLSERRAEAVKKALEQQLSGSGLTLVAKGYGEARPVAPNKTEDGEDNPKGRKLNRRVEIVYAK